VSATGSNVPPAGPGIAQDPACDGQAGMHFTGVTASATIAQGQKMVVSGMVDLGAGAAAVSNLTMNVCTQAAGQATPTSDANFVGDVLGTPLKSAANTIVPFSLTRTFTGNGNPANSEIVPGTYTVGLCACVLGTDVWTTDFSWLTVTVTQ
jgi:hypothetical protein